MDGDGFADVVVVADFEACESAAVFFVLRGGTDDAVGVEGVVAADGGMADEGDVVEEFAAGAEGDLGADDAEGPDLDVVGDRGTGVDGGLG